MREWLLRGLIAERFGLGVGLLVAGSPSLAGRMMAIRHIALGASLVVARDRRDLLPKIAWINAGVEFGDAVTMVALRRPKLAAGALLGGLGCLALAVITKQSP